MPYLPQPLPWVGWYAAIEDLLDDLPESQFAPWQMARLPELLQSVLIDSKNVHQEWGKLYRTRDESSFTITTDGRPSHMPRAFLVQVQGEGGDGIRLSSEPMQTVTANHGAGKYRAFLLSGGGAIPKALLVDGANTSGEKLIIRADSDPALTVTTGGTKHPVRVLLEQGRVAAMTPRALARFQSFPDTFELPDNPRLAAKGIGNALPPQLYTRIIHSLLEALQDGR